MTSPATPSHLRVDGLSRALGAGAAPPLFSWAPDPAQRSVRVRVFDEEGPAIWDSGDVATTLPELRYSGPELRSRSTYRWRIRIEDGFGEPSVWSDPAAFETTLLAAGDWRAKWISRPVPAAQRIIRSIESDSTSWIEPGQSLEQTFTSAGPVRALNVDVTSSLGEEVHGVLELAAENGDVIATRSLHGGVFPWDRFSQLLEVDPPAPAGSYQVRVRSTFGRIGWRTAHQPEPRVPDDRVSPLPVMGTARRDGRAESGVRTLGIETIPAPNPRFSREFNLPAAAASARLHAVGVGYGDFAINGTPVGVETLEPAPTAYDRTVLFRTYDVTSLLLPGRNIITAELGRGFFATRGASTWAWNLAPWHAEPALIAQLEIIDDRGAEHIVISDSSWSAAESATRSEVLYTGEEIRLGAEQPRWEPALEVAGPAGSLRPATLPGIRRLAPIAPLTTTHQDVRTSVYDFGSILAGRVRLRCSGPEGAGLTIRYGEYLSADGSVFCDNVLAAGEAQTDRLTLSSTVDDEPWESRFAYKGFRFVSIERDPSIIVHSVVAVPLRTDVQLVGELACEEPTLSWIDQATARTFLNNLHGIPTDTPVYEKNGWTADAHLATEAVLHHVDLRAVYGKWMDDHRDAQMPDGIVPQIVPTPDWGAAADPAWSASMVLIPWNLYEEYGDQTILERNFDAARRYTDAVLELADNGLWTRHSWGDWLSPGHQFAPEGPGPTATMMLRLIAQRMADIAATLGHDELEHRYLASADEIAAAYHQRYFDEASGSYRAEGIGYRQTMNILPLAFGAVPDQHVADVLEGLVRDLQERTDGHLDCGSVGAKYLLPLLSDLGRDDLAITVATQPDRPGWGVWMHEGSQTLLEAWDATARSHDHYFLGAAAAWVQQQVVGLRRTAPGWERFDIEPVVDDRVRWGRIAHRSVRGMIATTWHRDGSQWTVDATVPAGSTARLLLPHREPLLLTSGTHSITIADESTREDAA